MQRQYVTDLDAEMCKGGSSQQILGLQGHQFLCEITAGWVREDCVIDGERNERVGSMVEKVDLEIVEVLGGDEQKGNIHYAAPKRMPVTYFSTVRSGKVERTGFEQEVARCE